MDTATNNRLAFFRWLSGTHPNLYRAVLPAIQQPNAVQMAGIFDFLSSVGTSIANGVSKVADLIPQLASTYVNTKSQVDLIKVNLQRAQAGQAPVTALPAGSSGGGPIATTSDGSFFSQIPVWGWVAIGVGGFFVLNKMMGRR